MKNEPLVVKARSFFIGFSPTAMPKKKAKKGGKKKGKKGATKAKKKEPSQTALERFVQFQ